MTIFFFDLDDKNNLLIAFIYLISLFYLLERIFMLIIFLIYVYILAVLFPQICSFFFKIIFLYRTWKTLEKKTWPTIPGKNHDPWKLPIYKKDLLFWNGKAFLGVRDWDHSPLQTVYSYDFYKSQRWLPLDLCSVGWASPLPHLLYFYYFLKFYFYIIYYNDLNI